ncbi:unnamed protein product [Rangifer tarandus platyrhynchus]|uniref:Uncharacterized protein n=2 Tax=Rangifer tarandus platyrhynchus TaxID=3082113 RepID=A0AC59ZCZ9_RANTA|nr:unnamed protein product [Rangifer tarandus platyrhynchus]
MSLFSLLTLSITKNSPQDEQGQTPLSPSQSCASENGMDTAEWESHPSLPLLHSAPGCRAGGGTLLAAAETPGCLGDLDSDGGRRGSLHRRVGVSFHKSSLPKATAIPFSASLRFKPKPVFLYLKIKK